MTIEAELSRLVKCYTAFDSEQQCYTAQLDKTSLLRLDINFIQCLNQQLLADGAAKVHIDKNYRKLSLFFHPDKSSDYSPETRWLEQQLSEGRNDGTCFKSLSGCYERLTAPDKFKEIDFSSINSKNDCRQWLEQLKAKSSTYSSRTLYTSLIDLLDQSSTFFDMTGAIKPRGLKTLISFVPVVIASFGATIVMEELFAIYFLYLVILKSGQRLSQSDLRELRELGQTMQDYTKVTAMVTTTLLVRILELIFWTSRHCLHLTLELSSRFFTPMLAAYVEVEEQSDPESTNFCSDLILASAHDRSGMHFDTPELKVIAAPLEHYLGLNAQQLFPNWRLGGTKRSQIEVFLFRLRVMDQMPGALDVKLAQAKNLLDNITKDETLCNGTMAKAIGYAQQVIKLLQADSSSSELLLCDEPSSPVCFQI